MFKEVTKTWSPVTGCLHNCSYCYARKLAETRLKHLPQYQNGFKPSLAPDDRKFMGGIVFVSSMGDLFGEDVPNEWIRSVLGSIKRSSHATFYLLTKNPKRYIDFAFPLNVVLGTTLESNYVPDGISKAIVPLMRYDDFKKVHHRRKFISVEPIMDFKLEQFIGWIKGILPEFVYVGYDNYPQRNHLPEPSLAKTQELIAKLRSFTEVRKKTLRKAWSE